MSTFAENLKNLRLASNLTQEQLSTAIGIATSTIAMYENGSRLPSLNSAIKISDFFNIPIGELLDSTEQVVATKYDNKKNIINSMLIDLSIVDLEEIIHFIKFIKSKK